MPDASDPRPGGRSRRRKPRRIGSWAVVVLGAVVCLVLGYWQLSRWNSSTGTFQNLGYAFQWPFFALFLVLAFRRFRRLEDQRAEDAAAADDLDRADDPAADATGAKAPAAAPEPARRPSAQASAAPTEIPADLLPTRIRTVPDPREADETLRAYNDYLAELGEQDARDDAAAATRKDPHRR